MAEILHRFTSRNDREGTRIRPHPPLRGTLSGRGEGISKDFIRHAFWLEIPRRFAPRNDSGPGMTIERFRMTAENNRRAVRHGGLTLFFYLTFLLSAYSGRALKRLRKNAIIFAKNPVFTVTVSSLVDLTVLPSFTRLTEILYSFSVAFSIV